MDNENYKNDNNTSSVSPTPLPDKEITQNSLQERIRRVLDNARELGNDLYGTEEENQLQLSEMDRIEEGFKAFNKKLVATQANRWGYSPSGYMSKSLISKHLNSVKNGLYSIYPIPCKQGGCPYGASCIALQNNIEPPYGEPCVIETTRIEQLIVQYSTQFDFDSASATDRIQIRELVQLDILMDRCQNLMAQDVDILQQVVAGITEKGETFSQPIVSKYYDAWERMSKRKQSLLDDLMGTRKSRKNMPKEVQGDEDILLKFADQDGFMEVEERPEKFKNPEIQEG